MGYAAIALAFGGNNILPDSGIAVRQLPQPVAIMASLPLSLIGVFLALLITGSTLNIFSIIGFIMLMGLVTKNAILLVDFIIRPSRRAKIATRQLSNPGNVRLRPILMTTMAMIFGHAAAGARLAWAKAANSARRWLMQS